MGLDGFYVIILRVSILGCFSYEDPSVRLSTIRGTDLNMPFIPHARDVGRGSDERNST
jgi:hypothetical protein